MGTRYVFVGERPSRRAEQIGATWQNGRLAGATLRGALNAAGLDPDRQRYVNLYQTAARERFADARMRRDALAMLRRYAHEGWLVVGMGGHVCKVLREAGIPHRCLVHPAARGAIRKRERYQAHVREVLDLAEALGVAS